MDDDGGLGMRNWAYYEQPLKGNLGLQLMSSVADRNATKPLLSNGGFFHRDCSMPEPPAPIEYVRDGWISHRENKMVHMMPANSSYSVLPDAHGAHALPMLQPPEPPKDDKIPMMDDPGSRKEAPLKKRAQAKTPKPKKPKKVAAPRNETSNGSLSRGRNVRKSMDVVINGIDLDISGIPTPICSCTGTPQQCYRWGVGGWQSACCTTSISMYPLPMSTKRRGARIAGRKMSQGAFKKVLEKLAGEGYNLSNPIDLKTYWAKHGTNKFVTIR
ncbi:protein Barley B recombinant [Elaeis guineensis]|uniref:GAGA-binding transcriptional activator n=1 Tax=Elaeis guineensis var. tenera TaxID=51953 RepID=A0A6I9R3M7_ELAGV|nr:protein Barley B recombinant [Elaeis guineensis]